MDKLFLSVLNMSITGTFVVAVICLDRLSLRKAPKIISYCLWAVAGFRLAVPLSFESIFSLVPLNAQTIPPDIAMQSVPRIESGIMFVNDAVSNLLPSSAAAMGAGANPLQVWTVIGSRVWFAVAAALLILGAASYLRLNRKLRSAIRVGGNVYETDGIQSPFVSGILRPKIYIPLDLPRQEREYILLHERTHIRRHDHIIKFAAYLVLSLHWFNPLAWVAFLLMGVDMEMSCDEYVLKNLGGSLKKDYSMSLLSFAASRSLISGSPLAFGENGVKKRIKNVLNFRKSSRVAVAFAIAFVAVLSLGLLASRSMAGDLIVPDGVADPERVFAIADYYDEDGKFSALGLSLDENDSERVLSVGSGDILIVGDRRYEVTAQTLSLSFYMQTSLDQVTRWWTEYFEAAEGEGKVTLIPLQ